MRRDGPVQWLMPIASATLTLAPTTVLAHGGGLDASGCHTNSKTNNYHCHRGGSTGGSAPSGSISRPSGGSIYIAPSSAPTPRPTNQKPTVPLAKGPVSLVSVGDGDTIRVTTANGLKVTVRLACIDAPETAQGQSGADATEGLKQLLASGPLELRPQTIDKYGRTVAEVYTGGRNVNLELVRMGLAYAYRQYMSGCNANAYLDAEGQAEQYRQGAWRWGNEVKPWDFRKGS
jgi:micrococcal nuclease